MVTDDLDAFLGGVFDLAEDEICRCRAIAARYVVSPPAVTVVWDLNGLCAGQCLNRGPNIIIRLNAHIAQAEGDRYRATVAHEYAHAVAWSLERCFNHGPLWASMLRCFGYPPRRCHSYASAKRANADW